MKNRFNLIFFLCPVIIEVFYIQYILLNTDGNIPLYMFIYFETFLLFLLAFFLISRKLVSFHLPPALQRLFSKLTGLEGDLSIPAFVFISGIIFRLTLFPAALTTSPDAYRYVWEGKVIVNGFNPYEYEPASVELVHLHSADLPSKIHFKEKKAIYPPAAQVFFAAAYLISGEKLWGLKLLYLAAEILSMLFLMKLLRMKNKSPDYLILYAWLPLPVMEYFINAHLDVLGICFLMMFIYFFEKGKTLGSAVPFAVSFLIKFYPVFLIPLLIKRTGIRKFLLFGLLAGSIIALAYIPFISDKVRIFDFLLTYLGKWEFNASVYYLLKLMVSNETARFVSALLFVILMLIISYAYKDFTKAAAWIFAVFIIFSPTVYPWYLGWLAAVNPLYNFYSFMSLFFTSNLSNFTPLSPVWKEFTFVLLAEYVLFFSLLFYDWRRLRQ